jgi:hypothetical protein
MFTIKLYADQGYRQRIIEAESFTLLRPSDGSVEITLHGVRLNGEMMDCRFDLGAPPRADNLPWDKAIIENAHGKTTEIIYSDDAFSRACSQSAETPSSGKSLREKENSRSATRHNPA